MAEASNIDFKGIKVLDEQIDVLLSCKPLPESEIKVLCDKVSPIPARTLTPNKRLANMQARLLAFVVLWLSLRLG